MTEILVINSVILACGPFDNTEDSIVCPDIIYPKSVIDGYEIVEIDLPDDFSIYSYEYISGILNKKVVVIPFDREAWKIKRSAQVDAIKVDIDGMSFDGDEISQNRMARAILALKSANVSSTMWTLSDNTSKEVTADQLSQALASAGKAQTDIWMSMEE